MTVQVSQNPTVTGAAAMPMRAGVGRHLGFGRLARHRQALIGYGQLLAGAGGRLFLQVVYFFVLANALSLADMGVFASVSAAGVLIGCLAGFGFQAFVMRAAAGRRSSLGGYLAAYYVCFVLALPIMLALAGILYVALFREVIALPGYLAIIVAETVLWRLIELLVQVNNGLGRFGAAASIVSLPVGFRGAAAILFWAAGAGSVETWSAYYLAGNAVAAAVLAIAFHPRVRLRFRATMLKAKLRDSLLYAFTYFLFLAQGEIDKLIILSLAGERTAGIYAITMRLIDFTVVPLRPFFMIYSRKLIQAGRANWQVLKECLKVEAVVAGASTAGIVALVAILTLWPNMLGANVAAAYGMLAVVLAVPAVRNLLEFHGEMFFAFGSMTLRAAVTAVLVVLKALAFAFLLRVIPQPEDWGVWLNAIYLAIYAISFVTVYRLLVSHAVSPRHGGRDRFGTASTGHASGHAADQRK